MFKHIEPDYYPSIEKKLVVENKDFVTTNKTSIQNLSANQGDWKKPVLFGAAALALIWYFNND